MDTSKLAAIVAIIITLSVASERLVEIIKGFIPALNQNTLEPTDPTLPVDPVIEARRKAKVSILAVISGIVTAFLASPILAGLFKDLFKDSAGCPLLGGFLNFGAATPCGFDLSLNGLFIIFALGLLASGGSSFWNSVLEYLLKVKDLKKLEVANQKVILQMTMNTQMNMRATEAAGASNISIEEDRQ